MQAVALLVALYVFLDFSVPFIPGAFDFDPDESVEALVKHADARGVLSMPSTQAPVWSSWEQDEKPRFPVMHGLAPQSSRTFGLRRVPRLSSSDPPSPTDDH